MRGIYRTFDSIAGTPNQVGWGIYNLTANEATRDTLVAVSFEDVRGSKYVQHARFGYHRSWDLFLDPQGTGPYEVSALVRDVANPVPRVYFERLARREGARSRRACAWSRRRFTRILRIRT